MSDDILTIARRLAEAGHLPGIDLWLDNSLHRGSFAATEADIFFAVHNGIKAKEWPSSRIVYGLGACWTVFGVAAPGTDTTALLTAYAEAITAEEAFRG